MWERNHGYVLGQRNEARDERDAETERADRYKAIAEARLTIAVNALNRAQKAENELNELRIATAIEEVVIRADSKGYKTFSGYGDPYWLGDEDFTVEVRDRHNGSISFMDQGRQTTLDKRK